MQFFQNFFFFTFVFTCRISYAQKSPLKFGDVDIEDLKISKNPIDSSAGALVLMDFGVTSFDHNFQIVLDHHIRIKIFNSSEFDRATVKIPYASGDRVERLKAVTYNLKGGKIIESKLSRKDVYDEKVNNDVGQKRFSLPDVKEGSIIEYTYRVNYGSWVSLSPWYFQTSIPVAHSEYIVSLPEYFNYKKLNSGYIPLSDYTVTSKIGHYGSSTFNMDVHRFVAKNIPAFKDEPYMTSRENYISKIQFELNSINIPGVVSRQVMPSSYAALSKTYAESETFGKQFTKNPFLRDEIDRIFSGPAETEAKISAIYYYVRDSFEIDYDVLSDNLRRIFKLKKGFPQDINKILIAMYNEAGFEANAVRLSTRSNGRLHPFYALDTKFNYTICLVRDGDKEYLLDASKKSLPFNVLDKSCLNGKGMVVTAENFRWVDLQPSVKSKSKIYANFEFNETGNLQGVVSRLLTGYEAIEFRNEIEKDLKEYKKIFSENHASWAISKHEFEGVEQEEAPLKENLELELENYAQAMGDLIYFSPLIHGRIKKNPFKTADRLFPVDYGNPYEEWITCSIKIPEGYAAEEFPEQAAIQLPNNAGLFVYSVREVGGYIQLTSRININKVEFSAEEYHYLREFYAQIVEKQAEQVVLKKNS